MLRLAVLNTKKPQKFHADGREREEEKYKNFKKMLQVQLHLNNIKT